MKRYVLWVLMGLFVAMMVACGAQIQEQTEDGSNYNPDDFKTKEQPVSVSVAPEKEVQKGPKDPDGLLHRVAPELQEHLLEVRVDDSDQKVLVIFKSGEALKVGAEDLSKMQLLSVADGILKVEANGQTFELMYSK